MSDSKKTPPPSADAKHAKARAYLETISKAPMGADAVQYAPPLDRSEVIDIASGILQMSLTPDTNGRYFLTCPGAAMHSGGKCARRDCEFMPDGAPTLRCFHESCEAVLDELNRSIRSACGKAKVKRFSDATARAKKAAEALLIGFAVPEQEARALLQAWGRSCAPEILAADLLSGLKSAKRSYERAPAGAVGCLLKGGSMPSPAAAPPVPLNGGISSFVSARAVARATGAHVGVGTEQTIYLGAIGGLAKQVRPLIAAFEDDYGYRPKTILVGSAFDGALPDRIDGVPVRRWEQRDHSVAG